MALREVLRRSYQLGARPAEPGEFTKRAFLNGRLDLSQAQAVMDVIKARTRDSLRVAAGHLNGDCYRVCVFLLSFQLFLMHKRKTYTRFIY